MRFPGARVPITSAQPDGGRRAEERRLKVRASRRERAGVVVRPGSAGRFMPFRYGNGMTIADIPPIRALVANDGATGVCFDYLGHGLRAGGRRAMTRSVNRRQIQAAGCFVTNAVRTTRSPESAHVKVAGKERLRW